MDTKSLGNNEFEDGLRRSPFLENIDTPILASNIIVHKNEKLKIHKSIIINIGGTQVGLVGYLTPDVKILDRAGIIEYIDEILAIKEEVANLQAQNVQIIIALGHSNQRKAIEIATEVEGIDLVLNGYINSFFWNGTDAETNSKHEDQVIVTQISGKSVPVFNSHAYNKHLGKILLKFDVTGDIVDYKLMPVLLDSSIPQDLKSSQMVNKLNSEVATTLSAALGKTAVVLDGESCRLEECNLGNLVADSVMYYYAVRFQGEYWSNAPIAVIHGGSFAGSISPPNRPAGITTNNLLTAIPSPNNIVVVTTNGTILMQMLEHSVANYRWNNPSGQFLQFSGIQVVYDLAKDPGSRIVSARVRCANCSIPQFFSIDNWREYRILMPASLADGQFGYSMLVGLPRVNLDYDEITCTSDFIQLRSLVYPEVSGRINLLNTDSVPDSAVKMGISALLVPILTVYSFG